MIQILASPTSDVLDRRGTVIKTGDCVSVVEDTHGRPDLKIPKRMGIVKKVDIGSKMITVLLDDGNTDFFSANKIRVERHHL